MVARTSNSPRQRKAAVIVGVTGALALLAYFKYYNFALLTAGSFGLWQLVGTQPPFSEVVIPIAISFFTFHAISYMVDAYAGRMVPTRNLRDVMLYISFFPHLVAGPIVRAADFIPQIEAGPKTTARPYADAMALIVGGLFKKVVFANYLSVMVADQVFTAPEPVRRRRHPAGGGRLCVPDLLRFLGLYRHRHRRCGAARLSLSRELQPALSLALAARVLDAVAHFAEHLVARLPLHPARRQPARHGAAPSSI